MARPAAGSKRDSVDVVRQRLEQRPRGQRDRRDADGPGGLGHEREAAVPPRALAWVEREQDEARGVRVAPRQGDRAGGSRGG